MDELKFPPKNGTFHDDPAQMERAMQIGLLLGSHLILGLAFAAPMSPRTWRDLNFTDPRMHIKVACVQAKSCASGLLPVPKLRALKFQASALAGAT